MRCFDYFDLEEFRERFGLDMTEKEIEKMVDSLVYYSFKSNRTIIYDQFQMYTNNIYE